jgi:hypothetical protein
MRPTNEHFEIGDRVRLNELGGSRIKRAPSKAGKVVGFGVSGAGIRVLFDGLSRPTTLHQKYLTKEMQKAVEARHA